MTFNSCLLKKFNKDIDECKLGLHQCPSNSDCVNKEGWYYCQCRQGYKRRLITDDYNAMKIKCEGISIQLLIDLKRFYLLKTLDTDECSEGVHTCHDSAKCVNTDGGYRCDCSSENQLCLKCIHNNNEHFNGETWLSGEGLCEECLCSNGIVTCHKQTCDCGSAHINLDCCPQCDTSDKVCRHQKDSSKIYKTGQNWVYDCQRCECMVSDFNKNFIKSLFNRIHRYFH